MGKKSKQYWFNALTYELSKTEPIDGESNNLDEHLTDWLKRSHDMLNAASRNGSIETLAYRYADGDTDLTKKTTNTPAAKYEKPSATSTPPHTKPADSTISSINESKIF